MTIVPSDGGAAGGAAGSGAGGEVSYVLIVQQPDEGKGKTGTGGEGDGEMGVYDFDGEDQEMPPEVDDKAKVKVAPKRSQTVNIM